MQVLTAPTTGLTATTDALDKTPQDKSENQDTEKLPGTGPGAALGVGGKGLEVAGGGKGTVEEDGPGRVAFVTVHTNFEASDGEGGLLASHVSLR